MVKLDKIINYLKNKCNLNKGFFCIYGSYATDSQNNNSDIDILYIDKETVQPLREGHIYNGIDITVYKISENILCDDSHGKYGGFFCGKLFNPHLIFGGDKDSQLFIDQCICIFFSNLLSNSFCDLNEKYTADDILKKCIIIYCCLYPEYLAYLMRLKKTNNFNIIWNKWKKWLVSIFLKNNIIYSQISSKYNYCKVIDNQLFERKKIDYISRFWSFGAISHNNISFYDYYKSKNLNYILNDIPLFKKTCAFLGLSEGENYVVSNLEK